MFRTITDQDMALFVIESVAPYADDYDVPAIVAQLKAEFGLVDLETVPTGRYWEIIRDGEADC